MSSPESPAPLASQSLSASLKDDLPSPLLLKTFYFVFLGSMGVLVSFLPLALREKGVSLTELSTLLFFPAIIRILAPTLWGYLADRFQLTGTLLRIAAWGSVLAYLPILSNQSVWVGVGLVGFVFFRLPTSVLADALTFQRVARSGGSFGGYRMWGTVGYVLANIGGGYFSEAYGASLTVASGLIFLVIAAVMTHWLPRQAPTPQPSVYPALKAMLSNRTYLLFLTAVMLHTVGQTTYDNYFPLHLDALGMSRHLIGWSVALGATCEVLVMSVSRPLLTRFGAIPVFACASALAVVRWSLNAWVTDPVLLLGIQALHGITFGAWWIAAATYVDEHAPPQIRASAQGLLSVVSYGIGGIVATVIGATIGEHMGSPAQFQTCAGLALCAFALLLVIHRGERRQELLTGRGASSHGP